MVIKNFTCQNMKALKSSNFAIVPVRTMVLCDYAAYDEFGSSAINRKVTAVLQYLIE